MNKCFACDGLGRIKMPKILIGIIPNFEPTCHLCFGSGFAELCDVCQKADARGTVGSMTDPNVFIMCCETCYRDELKMRPAGSHE